MYRTRRNRAETRKTRKTRRYNKHFNYEVVVKAEGTINKYSLDEGTETTSCTQQYSRMLEDDGENEMPAGAGGEAKTKAGSASDEDDDDGDPF